MKENLFPHAGLYNKEKPKRTMLVLLALVIVFCLCFGSVGQQAIAESVTEEFGEAHILCEFTGEEFVFTNLYPKEPGDLYGWTVYLIGDYDIPIQSISPKADVDTVRLEKGRIQPGKIYEMEATLKRGDEVKTIIAPEKIYFFENTEQDVLPEFSIADIWQETVDGWYRFENQFEEKENYQFGWTVYKNGEEVPFVKTEGRTFEFRESDLESSYVIYARVSTSSNETKEIAVRDVWSQKAKADFVDIIETPDRETAELLYDGIWKGSSVNILNGWDVSQVDSRSDRYQVYSFAALRDALSIAVNEADDEHVKYRDWIFEVVTNWIDNHQEIPDKTDDNAWHDDAIGRRLKVMCDIYLMLGDHMDDALRATMKDSMASHAKVLSSGIFYTENHNHGMFQDKGLLSYCILFRYEEPLTEYYQKLARERVQQYFDNCITPDGVLNEHSPSYHLSIVNEVYWFSKNLMWTDVEAAQGLFVTIAAMRDYVLHMTMPNGKMPAIGDSGERSPYSPAWSDDPLILYAMTSGVEGEVPLNDMAVFPDGGYGIIRSSWLDQPEDATWMVLTAATHGNSHKHNDDLSFLLYHKGKFITESGQRNYDYTNEYTKHTYSSYAHNVLFINGEAWAVRETDFRPRIDARARKTAIVNYGDEGGVQWVTGRSFRWKSVTQDRSLSYQKEQGSLVVKDILKAEESLEARVIYHVDESVQVEPKENGWVCFRDGEEIAEIIIEGSAPVTLSTITGEGEEPFFTWIFESRLTPIYSTVLVVDMLCKEGGNEISACFILK